MISEVNIREVKKSGISIIPDFLNLQECEAAISEIDRVIMEHKDLVSIDKYGCDHRVYGFEYLSKYIQDKLLLNTSVLDALSKLYKVNTVACTLLGQLVKGSTSNNGSGASWHRDSLPSQYKAFCFLTKVTDNSGAFEYYPGSHTILNKASSFFAHGTNLDYTNINNKKLSIKKKSIPKKLVCEPGTLVILDTSSIHRGSPNALYSRYSFTYYAFAKVIPPHIDKVSKSSFMKASTKMGTS